MTTPNTVIVTVSVLATGVTLLVWGNLPSRSQQSRWEITSLAKPPPGGISGTAARSSFSGALRPTRRSLALPEALPEVDDLHLGMLADRWARQDPIGAAVWVAGLAEGPEKTRVISAMSAAWVGTNPQAAADLIIALKLPDGEAKTQAAASVASAWAMTDPLAAARWVETFPAGHGREYAMENVAFQWVQSDPVAFMDWVERLSGTADRDAAINAGVGTLVESDPDLAVRLSEAIGNQVTRQSQMERAARRWLETDQTDARRWIRGSSLPAEAKQRLLAQAQPDAGH